MHLDTRTILFIDFEKHLNTLQLPVDTDIFKTGVEVSQVFFKVYEKCILPFSGEGGGR